MTRKRALVREKRIRKSGTGTDAQYEECLREHLPYEIDMLRCLYEALLSKHNSFVGNALIESFFLHARNLVAFFKNDTDCGFDIRYFTKRDYQVDASFVPASLVKRINQQVQHLGFDRTENNLLKLGPTERTEICDLLEQQIKRFEGSLDTQFKLICHTKPVALEIPFSSIATATNATTVI